MKVIFQLIGAFALTQVFFVGLAEADTVKASVAATRGEVSANGGKIGSPLPVSLKAGSIIKSGADSGAIVIPVPGQTVFVDQNTDFELKRCEMTGGADSSWTRRSVCVLKKGHVHTSIAHPKAGASEQELITPRATLSAHGTSWSTWSDDNSVHVAVYAGVVTITFGAVRVDLLPGQVATLTGGDVRRGGKEVVDLVGRGGKEVVDLTGGSAAVLEVLDLKTGTIARYTQNSPGGETELASASQISAARDLFWLGLGAFSGTASEADRLAFSQIVEEINKLLALNHLPALNRPFEWGLWPDWFRLDPTLQNLASPEQPLK